MSIERKLTYIFSSDPTKGARAIQEEGSVFSVNLQYPISLPHGTQYATMEVHSASIWYVTPNISQAKGNNKLSINELPEYALKSYLRLGVTSVLIGIRNRETLRKNIDYLDNLSNC